MTALTLGDAAPVDLSAGQTARGSTTITDEAGQAVPVDLDASLFVNSASSSGESVLRLTVMIGGQVGDRPTGDRQVHATAGRLGR